MIGVVPHYKAFRKCIKQNKDHLAPLQLLGRLEDYLTKEFASLIFQRSKTSTLPIMNLGKSSDKRRIDLVLVNGDISKGIDKKQLRIWAFIELKYLRNKHRFGDASAEDEHEPVFRSLHKQLRRTDVDIYADYPVRLRTGKQDTYGLVFASFVRRSKAEDPKPFLKKIIAGAKKHGFKTYNFKVPRLRPLYTDVPVTILRGKYLNSLYAGLWRLSETEPSECTCKGE